MPSNKIKGTSATTKETLATPFTEPRPSVPSSTSGDHFTADQITRFQQRFDEGYDILTDPECVQWLKIHHPDTLPADHNDFVTSVARTIFFSHCVGSVWFYHGTTNHILT
jgi:hypothetical protein